MHRINFDTAFFFYSLKLCPMDNFQKFELAQEIINLEYYVRNTKLTWSEAKAINQEIEEKLKNFSLVEKVLHFGLTYTEVEELDWGC